MAENLVEPRRFCEPGVAHASRVHLVAALPRCLPVEARRILSRTSYHDPESDARVTPFPFYVPDHFFTLGAFVVFLSQGRQRTFFVSHGFVDAANAFGALIAGALRFGDKD